MTAAINALNLDAQPTTNLQVNCDHITLLRPVGPSCHLTKIFAQDADGAVIEVEPEYKPKYFVPETKIVTCLDDLLPILQEGNPKTGLVRATPKKKNATRIRRVTSEWVQQQLRLVGLDVDSLQLPDHIDLIENTKEAVQFVIDTIAEHWPEVRNADVLWQVSASAGFKPGVRLHLWFWADKPLSNRHLLHKTKQVNKAAGYDLIDTSLYHRLQLHYIGHPILKDIVDPFHTRAGIIHKDGNLKTNSVKQDLPELPVPPEGLTNYPSAQLRYRNEHNTHPSGFVNLPYLAGLIRGVFSDTNNDTDGRKRRLYVAAVRLASLLFDQRLVDAIHQLGHTPHGLKMRLIEIGISIGLTPNRTALDVENGWNYGLTLQVDSKKLWTSHQRHRTKRQTTNQEDAAPTMTLAQARRAMSRRLHQIQPGQALVIASEPGTGKSTAKFNVVSNTRPDGALVILVEKDRQAVMNTHNNMTGSTYLLGKSGAGEHAAGWKPTLTPNGDLSSCGNPIAWARARLGGSSRQACAQCRFQEVCSDRTGTALGSRAQWDQLSDNLRHGGVLVTTDKLLLPILERYNELKPHLRAPLHQLWLDDVPHTPGLSTLTLNQLQQTLDLLTDTNHRTALSTLIELLNQFAREVGVHVHGHHIDPIQTRSRLQHLNTTALLDATKLDGIPLALKTLCAFLNDTASKAVAFLVCDSSGNPSIELAAPPPNLPGDTSVVIASATTQAPMWQAWLGRPVTTWKPNLNIQTDGLWLQSALFHQLRFQLSPLDQLINTAQRQAHAIAPKLKGVNNLLVCTHKAILDNPRFKPVLDALLEHAQLPQGAVRCIHWRGIDQVGSNAFDGFDAVLSLGDPNIHFGAWIRFTDTLEHWLSGTKQQMSYDREAQGWADQLDGRLRPIYNTNCALLHIGNTPSKNLLSVCPDPVRTDARPGPIPTAAIAAHKWILTHSPHAISAVLAQYKDAPHRSTLERLYQVDDRPTWSIHLSGKGAPQKWKAHTFEQAHTAATQLLCRGGGQPERYIKRIVSDEYGVEVYSSGSRIQEEGTQGLEGKRNAVESGVKEVEQGCHNPPPTEQCVAAVDVDCGEPGLSEKVKARLVSLVRGRKGPITVWTVSEALGLPTWMVSAKTLLEAASYLGRFGYDVCQLVGGHSN